MPRQLALFDSHTQYSLVFAWPPRARYSYFFESFEGFNTLEEHELAAASLKYMLLCKIMTNSPSDVHAIIHGKAGIKYAGVEVDAMRSLADAHKERSLKSFEACLLQFKPQLADDVVVSAHITSLYETLLEANLLRILEPFSRVQLAHVATLIALPLVRVEAKYVLGFGRVFMIVGGLVAHSRSLVHLFIYFLFSLSVADCRK